MENLQSERLLRIAREVADSTCWKTGSVNHERIRQAAYAGAKHASDQADAIIRKMGDSELPANVIALVVAARQVLEGGYVSTSIEEERDDAEALNKALEAFASRVCWDDEGGELPEAHADPCTCGQQGGSGE